MALPRYEVLAALSYILRNPTAVIPGTHADENRRNSAANMASMSYSVNVGSTPQNTSEPLQVTMTRLGGLTAVNADSFPKTRWPVVELATWMRIDSARNLRQVLLDFDQCITDVIYGLSGTFSGVTIYDIAVDVDPFQVDDVPADGSDRWVNGLTHTMTIQHANTSPSHRRAVGVSEP